MTSSSQNPDIADPTVLVEEVIAELFETPSDSVT